MKIKKKKKKGKRKETPLRIKKRHPKALTPLSYIRICIFKTQYNMLPFFYTFMIYRIFLINTTMLKKLIEIFSNQIIRFNE